MYEKFLFLEAGFIIFKVKLAPATYSRWLALPIYWQTCNFETTRKRFNENFEKLEKIRNTMQTEYNPGLWNQVT